MTSSDDSPAQATLFSGETPMPTWEKEPLIVLEIPGRLPSWNEVLAMQHFTTRKHGIQIINRPDMHRLLFGPFGKGEGYS